MFYIHFDVFYVFLYMLCKYYVHFYILLLVSWMQDPGSWMQDPGSPGCRHLDPGSWILGEVGTKLVRSWNECGTKLVRSWTTWYEVATKLVRSWTAWYEVGTKFRHLHDIKGFHGSSPNVISLALAQAKLCRAHSLHPARTIVCGPGIGG